MRIETIFTIALLLTLVIFAIGGLSDNKAKQQVVQTTKVDSLNRVVDSLQMEIFYLEDGFDHKEHIYEQAIYDCEHRKNHRETLRRLNNE